MNDYQIMRLDAAPRVLFKFDGRILFSSDRFEMVHLSLDPGASMELHTQPFDVVFYLSEGSGILTIGLEELEIQSETSVMVQAGVTRAWKNNGKGMIKILVCKLKE